MMETVKSSSSSCWCCAECIQSRLDRRHSALPPAAAAADNDDDDAVYNGELQTDEMCGSDIRETTAEHRQHDVSSSNCDHMYLVCLPLTLFLCVNVINNYQCGTALKITRMYCHMIMSFGRAVSLCCKLWKYWVGGTALFRFVVIYGSIRLHTKGAFYDYHTSCLQITAGIMYEKISLANIL